MSTIEALPSAALGSDRLLEAAGYLTKKRTAKELGISERTLARFHTKRQGPPRIRIGKKILYRRDSLIAWLGSQEETQPTRTVRKPITPARKTRFARAS
jgi:hypothetical protein